MVLPFFVLTVSYLGEYSLIMRSSLLEILSEDYVQLARAKGLREKVVRRNHAVPNALLPTMTVTILSLGFVISGAITIELIFSWPGLGLLTANADRRTTTSRSWRACSCSSACRSSWRTWSPTSCTRTSIHA